MLADPCAKSHNTLWSSSNLSQIQAKAFNWVGRETIPVVAITGTGAVLEVPQDKAARITELGWTGWRAAALEGHLTPPQSSMQAFVPLRH